MVMIGSCVIFVREWGNVFSFGLVVFCKLVLFFYRLSGGIVFFVV